MNRFVVAFGTEGAEFVCNITKVQEEAVLEKLMADDNNMPEYNKEQKALAMFKLRVIANPQRHIETYVLNAEDNLIEDDIWGMFENNAKYMITLVRERGVFIKSLSIKANFKWEIE